MAVRRARPAGGASHRADPARRGTAVGLARYRAAVARLRRCSRNGCTNPAVATLTFAYADSTAVVGPLATAAEPHSYDLCSAHAQGLTAPKGWEVVRPDDELDDTANRNDDLEALANAVREAGRADRGAQREPDAVPPDGGRRGHLRVLPSPDA